MKAPVPVQDIHAGREAFAQDLDLALRGHSLAERGWAMPNDLTLLLPLFATAIGGGSDIYFLKLFFDHYSNGPPSAQFVNPLTLSYTFPGDVMWVPEISGNQEIACHTNYNNGGQLICSSTTLEFYKVNHDVKAQNIWRPGERTFMSTISAIKSGLAQPCYKGRMKN